MKIGAFAKYFNTTKATIRYYTELKLLMPTLEGTYPNYDASCIEDMNAIIFYQQLGFSNNEIIKLLTLKRFYVTKNKNYQSEFKKLIIDKIEEHHETIKKSHEMIHALEMELSNQSDLLSQKIVGLTFDALKFLACPHCQDSFEVNHASIKSGLLVTGTLSCSCGTLFKIEDGVVLPIEINLIQDIYRSPDDSEQQSHLFKILKQCAPHIAEKMDKFDAQQGIVMLNVHVDLMYIGLEQYFKPNGHYLLCSNDLEVISILRIVLEKSEFLGHLTLIYANGSPPLKPKIPYAITFDYNATMMSKESVNQHYLQLYEHQQFNDIIGVFWTSDDLVNKFEYPILNDQVVNNQFQSLGYHLDDSKKIASLPYLSVLDRILKRPSDLNILLKHFTRQK